MPYYHIHHACTLTESQKHDLANSITTLHSTSFSTPKLFVNVRFTSLLNTTDFYVGGRQVTKTHILAHVRTGASRTTKDWNKLCADLEQSWDEIVPLPKVKRSAPDEDRSLYSIFILGGMAAGREAGLAIPMAGDDVNWLSDNMAEFKTRAANGQEEFADLVKEVEERGLISDNGKAAKDKFEEAMGWGDSA
ncbi:hypothetical protein B0A48_04778 [Cryoendolithus antarcticus]|uniref:Tautomerase cis-CaaD-like domain-containing protein n=1 Tax=Cryoendolithus antarcticus TaxID=1507870 RepID=A0A1V8TDC3_9PEZI|nr:hypothetical protein B0A48_04778 [Cryoendolithus antarcticus]